MRCRTCARGFPESEYPAGHLRCRECRATAARVAYWNNREPRLALMDDLRDRRRDLFARLRWTHGSNQAVWDHMTSPAYTADLTAWKNLGRPDR
jgi:hypothetical protein